jgi:hypothetical protein
MVTYSLENLISHLKQKLQIFFEWEEKTWIVCYIFLGKCRYCAVSDSAWWEWCRNLRSFACFNKIRPVFKGASLRRNNPRGKGSLSKI